MRPEPRPLAHSFRGPRELDSRSMGPLWRDNNRHVDGRCGFLFRFDATPVPSDERMNAKRGRGIRAVCSSKNHCRGEIPRPTDHPALLWLTRTFNGGRIRNKNCLYPLYGTLGTNAAKSRIQRLARRPRHVRNRPWPKPPVAVENQGPAIRPRRAMKGLLYQTPRCR